jgi:nucleolar MIF4G domain-containing protein 1
MNTDVRRRIFVALMGADDYVDAHTRLTRLRLAKGQQAEIVRVLLECCGQEGVFNRYYALLGARLCESHREVRFAMTFAFWDAFKQLPELSLHRAANTAKLLANLVHAEAVPVTCLKVVHWSAPSQRTIFFWQVFFVELLAAPPPAVAKACAPLLEPTNGETRDGVLLFLERHLKRTIVKQHPALGGALKRLVAALDSRGPTNIG